MSSQDKKVIFIIEDELFLAKVWKAKLEKEGFEIIESHIGSNVVIIAENLKPNLILLDIGLPEISGLDILEDLKKINKTKKIPVIIITKISDKSNIKIAKDLGVTEYLIKSQLKFTDIIDVVKKHVR